MEEELKNLIKVWFLAITSLCYCYYIASRLPKGLFRLFSLFPVFSLFVLLPLNLSSVHLTGTTSFFLVWLANFKLLLFSFNQGPLSPPPSNLFHFISLACLPIKLKADPPKISHQNPPANSKPQPSDQKPQKSAAANLKSNLYPPTYFVTNLPRSILLGIKALILVIIFYSYNYKHHFHQNVLLVLYCCHIYLQCEIVLAMCAAPTRAIFGFELEPQFNEPYLATSLQDFWGRRWNLMVPSILRPTVYKPVRCISTRIVGPIWAPMPAVIAAFVVSGLMHELIFYYFTRVSPTWEVTLFFVLHGICTVVEVVVKRSMPGKWQLPQVVAAPLVVAFVVATSDWLFLPTLIRNGVADKAIEEYWTSVDFVSRNLVSIYK